MDMVCGIMNQSDNSKTHPPGREGLVELTTVAPNWDRFFTIAPLNLVGTREADGSDDLAPKHMACPRPSRWLQTSVPASPRCDDGGKPSLSLVQKLCGLRALTLLRRSTRVELNPIFDELLFPQTAST
jgi:hypothetical protein